MKVLNSAYRSFKHAWRKHPMTNQSYTKLYDLKTKWLQRRTYQNLKRLEQISDDRLRKMQDRMLLNILRYANENTTYYNNLFRENNIDVDQFENFNEIPLLTKELIRTNSKDLLSKEFKIRELVKKRTGGSTGEPLEFYCTNNAGMVQHGHQLYHYSHLGYKEGDVIIGGGGASVPKELRDKGIYWKTLKKGNPSGSHLFSILHLSPSNIDVYVNKILELRPAILRGHATFYGAIAKYMLNNNIQTDFPVKGIILTAEMCSLDQRLDIEKAFSSRVYFEYGHSEVCLYCYTKDPDTNVYHSSPLMGYMEVLNEDGSPTPVGEVGHIVVTGFVNRGMPFIRYHTGDLGRISKRNGGIVNLSELHGRIQAFAIDKDGKKIPFNPVIFGLLAMSLKNVIKWQIVQSEVGRIEFAIVRGKGYQKEDECEIKQIIESKVSLNIDFKYVDSIELTKRGKHLFFVQKL